MFRFQGVRGSALVLLIGGSLARFLLLNSWVSLDLILVLIPLWGRPIARFFDLLVSNRLVPFKVSILITVSVFIAVRPLGFLDGVHLVSPGIVREWRIRAAVPEMAWLSALEADSSGREVRVISSSLSVLLRPGVLPLVFLILGIKLIAWIAVGS